MKYMVLMYSNPAQTKAMSASELDAVMRKHDALRDELTESGELLSGAGLAYPEDTTTIRLRAGAGVAVAGPLMESDEQLSAYYVFECGDVERARHIAERGPGFPRHGRRGALDPRLGRHVSDVERLGAHG